MYRKTVPSWRKHWDFILMDFILMQLSFIISYAVFRGSWIYSNPVFNEICITMALSQAFIMFIYQPFKNILKRGYYKEFVQSVYYSVLVILMDLLIMFVLHDIGRVSRKVFVLGAVLYAVLTYLSRAGLKWVLKHSSHVSSGSRAVLLITSRSLQREVMDNLARPEFRDMRLCGTVLIDEDHPEENVRAIKVEGTDDDILNYLCREWVDEVFIRLPEKVTLPETVVNEIINMGISVHTCVLTPANSRNQYLERFGNYSVLTDSIKIVTARQMFLKRAADILGGIVGCIITLLIAIVIGPLIFIQSPGPIFFKQTRIGRNGKKFKMYKFRSMYMDAEKRKQEYMAQNKIQDGLMFKMDDDPRIIGSEHKDRNGKPKGIGNFIRNTSLDEFPQFLNVLMGQMSIVGTRPPTVDEWEQYELSHRVRMSIKPGITGLWQISGRSEITDFEEVVRMDSEYIMNWSLGEDAKIIFKTIGVVLRREGAE